jgi:membrane-associated phospholipid phosphatase
MTGRDPAHMETDEKSASMLERLLVLDSRWTAALRVADKPGFLRGFFSVLAHSGDSWFWLVGLILAVWLGSGQWRSLALAMIAGVLVTAVLVFLIKFIVRRERPKGEWGNIYRRTDPHSFPSGHAARAAMLAMLALSFGPPWLGAFLVVWALLVALARVAMGVHYLSDVAAGVVLGGLWGILEGWWLG